MDLPGLEIWNHAIVETAVTQTEKSETIRKAINLKPFLFVELFIAIFKPSYNEYSLTVTPNSFRLKDSFE